MQELLFLFPQGFPSCSSFDQPPASFILTTKPVPTGSTCDASWREIPPVVHHVRRTPAAQFGEGQGVEPAAKQ